MCQSTRTKSRKRSDIKTFKREGFLNFRDQTDIENKLRNQHLELNSQYRTNNDYNEVSKNDIQMCEQFGSAVNEDSRFENPISQFREMSPQVRGLHFSPHLHMNPQNVVANNDEKMTPVGRGGLSTRYDSKNDRYVRTNKQYKQNFTNGGQYDLNAFSAAAASLLPKTN